MNMSENDFRPKKKLRMRRSNYEENCLFFSRNKLDR